MNNIIILQKNGFVAKINSSRGGNLISFSKVGENSILREPCYDKELDNPYLYGMPILFPVNRISNGKFNFEGREYVFPINEEKTNCHLHGTLHQTPFDVVSKSDSSVTLKFCANNSEYLNFPHEFSVEISYKIIKSGIKIKTSIKNESNLNMPVFLGYHSTFNLSENSCVKVEIDSEYERNMVNYLPTGKILEFDEVSKSLNKGTLDAYRAKLSRHYKAKKNGKIVIFDTNSNTSTVYKNSNNLQYRLIYSDGLGYICLEPQTCVCNSANAPFDRKDSGFNYIKPNKKITYKSKILLLKGDCR